MHPLYYDIFDTINKKEEEKINIAEYTTKVIKQSLLGASDNPLRSMSKDKEEPPKYSANANAQDSQKIVTNFSKSNHKADVSAMKERSREQESEFSEKQKEHVYQPPRGSRIQRSNFKDQPVQRKLEYTDDFGS